MMQQYPILQNWLRESIQDLEPIVPEVFVAHSTANPGATDEDHVRWLNQTRQHGWATYYGDHDSIRQVVPEGWRAPAQGPSYNRKAISYEMCEPDRNLPWAEQLLCFQETWNRATWVAAWTCFRYGWGVDRVKSHAEISAELPGETDHTDPIAFFARYGRTWDDFKADVAAQLEEMRGAMPDPADWQARFMDALLATGLITQRRHPLQTVQWWEAAALFTRLLERIDAGKVMTGDRPQG